MGQKRGYGEIMGYATSLFWEGTESIKCGEKVYQFAKRWFLEKNPPVKRRLVRKKDISSYKVCLDDERLTDERMERSDEGVCRWVTPEQRREIFARSDC